MHRQDRYRGCLGGGAGDALGYAVEFFSEEAIFGRYGAGTASPRFRTTHS